MHMSSHKAPYRALSVTDRVALASAVGCISSGAPGLRPARMRVVPVLADVLDERAQSVSKTLLKSALTLLFATGAAVALAVPAGASGPTINGNTDATVIENTLRGALGDSYGYYWIDGSTVVVGVTNAGRAAAVRALG